MLNFVQLNLQRQCRPKWDGRIVSLVLLQILQCSFKVVAISNGEAKFQNIFLFEFLQVFNSYDSLAMQLVLCRLWDVISLNPVIKLL